MRTRSPRRSLSKVPARVRSRGLLEVLDLAAHRVREFFYSGDRLIMFALDLSSPPPQRPPPPHARFLRAGSDDALAYARDVGTDSDATFRDRLSEDTRCYLIVRDHLIVHSSWVTTSRAWTREIRRYFRPPPGEAYVYESFTRTEARGQGVYPFALGAIAGELAAERIGRLWVGVEAGNESSIKAVRKAGFEPGFEITYRRRLGRITVSPPQGPLARDCRGCLEPPPAGGQISA
jgi:ribosomal protein S18 acetylase RimI-like enzyme